LAQSGRTFFILAKGSRSGSSQKSKSVSPERAKVSHFSIGELFGIHPPRGEEDDDEKQVPAVVLPSQFYQLLQVLILMAPSSPVCCGIGGRLMTAPEPFLAVLRGSDP
jgi:hypothetical protein